MDEGYVCRRDREDTDRPWRGEEPVPELGALGKAGKACSGKSPMRFEGGQR